MYSCIDALSVGTDESKNEDALAVSDSCLIVLDGASVLCDTHVSRCSSDAEWFSNNAAALLLEMSKDYSLSLEMCAMRVLSKLKDDYLALVGKSDSSDYLDRFSAAELPSAALVMARIESDKLRIIQLGDCRAIVALRNSQHRVYGPNRIEILDAEALKRMVEIAKQKNISVLDARPLIKDTLLANRNSINTQQGYSAFSFYAMQNIVFETATLNLSDIESITLCSDGAFQLVDPFQIVSSAEKLHELFRNEGLSSSFQLLFESQDDDPFLNNYPRFKKRDDTTAIVASLDGLESL